MFLSIVNMHAVHAIDGRSAIEPNDFQIQSIGRGSAVRVITAESVGCHFSELTLSYEFPLPLSTSLSTPAFPISEKLPRKKPVRPTAFVNRRCSLTTQTSFRASEFGREHAGNSDRGTHFSIEESESIQGSWWAVLSSSEHFAFQGRSSTSEIKNGRK